MVYGEVTARSQVSHFNEGQLQILRLNKYWMQAEDAANLGKLQAWHFRLDTIWRELIASVLRLKDGNKFIIEQEGYRNIVLKIKDKTKLYEALNDRHQFLKVMQDKVGKGAKYKDSTDDDFD